MKKKELIIESCELKQTPFKINYWTTIVDVEKCYKASLAIVRQAVAQHNDGVRDGVYLDLVKDEIAILARCGCIVKVVDVN